MGPRSRYLASSLLLSCLALPVRAQLRVPGEPASARHELPSEVPLVVLPVPDVRALRAEDESRANWPLRYGARIPASIDLERSGRWDEVPASGELVWRIEIASPGARSLGVFFSEFDVPAKAQVFLYGAERGEFLGAYGEHDENPARTLAVQPLRGERIVIEYVEPPGVRERPRLSVGEVVHDYRDILAVLGGGSVQTISCLVDVNCPAGAGHQDAKRAVVWLLGGAGGCSGSILNNTDEDGTPYLLTAEHCGDMTNAVIVFDYENTGCGTGGASQSRTLSGAAFLAGSIPYDGQLYLLNQTPPASYEPFYAGWSTAATMDAPTVGISHPGGQPKKIQIDVHDPLRSSTRWNVDTDVGIVQPGSSGSPLFDRDQRVVGPLSTGTGSCGGNLAGYGLFDLFYSTRDLGRWLDPQGWGLSGIDGYEPFRPYARAYDGDGLNPMVYSSLTAPELGTTWTAEVDASVHPTASVSVIVGHARPAEGPVLGLGQLLVDLSSPRHFQGSAPVVSGLAQHAYALPPDPALAGFVSYTQAFLLGGGRVATNGVKLILNF